MSRPIEQLTKCPGCSACMATCPVDAIRMDYHDSGFYRPIVDEALCEDCGRCEAACPMLDGDSGISYSSSETVCHYAYAKDEAIRHASSSGGVFSVLASRVLNNGGVVYGAGFTPDFMVAHHRVDSISDLSALRGSKYVQSYIGSDCLRQVKRDLEEGRTVLFSGTGCQIEGLHSFLGKTSDTLISLEVICHGAPSPLLWQKYIDTLNTGLRQLSSVSFRDKSAGWQDYHLLFMFDDASPLSEPAGDNWYMRAFLDNHSINRCCFECPAKKGRVSDLLLGDFWGIEKQHPKVDSREGVSAVICNTGRGAALFDAVRSSLVVGDTEYDAIRSANMCLDTSVPFQPNHLAFTQDIKTLDIEKLMRKYPFKPTLPQKVKGKIRSILS